MDPITRKITRERREHRAAMMRARWSDPDYRGKMSAVHSARMKKLWADPEFAEKKRSRLAEFNRTPEQRQRAKERIEKLNADPAFKAKQSAAMVALHKQPKIKARTIEHARANAIAINAKRRAKKDVVPPGYDKLYRKLRHAGLLRKEALRECWAAYGASHG